MTTSLPLSDAEARKQRQVIYWRLLAGVFLPYHMGLYRRGASQAYVNTGTGYWLLPWRLGLAPEITLIELRSR